MTEIVRKSLSPSEGYEKILFMDDYGTGQWLNIPLTAASTRQALIDAKIAEMESRVTTLESYATDTDTDLSALKAAGIAKKERIKNGSDEQ